MNTVQNLPSKVLTTRPHFDNTLGVMVVKAKISINPTTNKPAYADAVKAINERNDIRGRLFLVNVIVTKAECTVVFELAPLGIASQLPTLKPSAVANAC